MPSDQTRAFAWLDRSLRRATGGCGLSNETDADKNGKTSANGHDPARCNVDTFCGGHSERRMHPTVRVGRFPATIFCRKSEGMPTQSLGRLTRRKLPESRSNIACGFLLAASGRSERAASRWPWPCPVPLAFPSAGHRRIRRSSYANPTGRRFHFQLRQDTFIRFLSSEPKRACLSCCFERLRRRACQRFHLVDTHFFFDPAIWPSAFYLH